MSRTRARQRVNGQLHLFCPDCDDWRPAAEFYVTRGKWYSKLCKPCHNADSHRRQRERRERVPQPVTRRPTQFGYPDVDPQVMAKRRRDEIRYMPRPGRVWWVVT